jgi:VWFA-related protein
MERHSVSTAMLWGTLGAALIFAFALASFAQRRAQVPLPAPFAQNGVQGVTPALKVKAELVLVDAQVLQKKTGRPIDSLTYRDFRVYENGVQQRVSFLSRDEMPLSVVFLFDLTDSVRPVLKPLAQGAREALQHLRPEDEVAVMVYAASAQLLQGFTRNRALAMAAIGKASRMKSKEAAFFNEGVFQAARETLNAPEKHSRRVIIWLTDNVPNIPSEGIREEYGKSVPKGALHSEKDAVRELFETGATVCTILDQSEMSDEMAAIYSDDREFLAMRMRNPPGDVFQYTEETGGIVVGSSKKDVSVKLAQLIDAIRARYTLGYAPTLRAPAGAFCRVKVKIARDTVKRDGKLVVRATQGYYRGRGAPN